VATADNPSALYYNPAGITQIEGQEIQFGLLSYLGITSTYQAPNGHESKTQWEYQPVPQLNYSIKPKNSNFAFGLGVYAPFGLGLQWPEDTGFRTLAIEGRVSYLTINPSVAWQIHPTLSLAPGPTINYSKVKLKQGIGLPGGAPYDQFNFNGDDFDLGFHAGVLWQPCPQWSFGFNYRSATTIDYQGTSQLSPYFSPTHTTSKVNYPQNVVVGVSYRPTPKWNLEFDVDWTDWNTLNTTLFNGTPLGNIPFPLNWRSSFFYEFGVTRYLENGWFVAGGYFFSSNSTSDQNFTPYVPDTDLNTGSLGFGRKGEHWNWALAGQIITGPWRTVNTAFPNPTSGESPNGRYKFFIPAVTFSVAYHF